VNERHIVLRIGQVLTVVLLAPLIQGIIVQFEERVQRKPGPGHLPALSRPVEALS
jgi:formate hydrogenlyase subunit 4